jgi:hypothetical protein
VPSICVWRDEPSGAGVVLLYETGYGSQKDVFVLPNGVAITAAWPGDNTGPGSLHAVQVPRTVPAATYSLILLLLVGLTYLPTGVLRRAAQALPRGRRQGLHVRGTYPLSLLLLFG